MIVENKIEKVEHLTNIELDYVIAQIIGAKNPYISKTLECCCIFSPNKQYIPFKPSSNYAHGGPLIEHYDITVEFQGEIGDTKHWKSYVEFKNKTEAYHDQLLICVMQSIIKHKYGEFIDIDTFTYSQKN